MAWVSIPFSKVIPTASDRPTIKKALKKVSQTFDEKDAINTHVGMYIFEFRDRKKQDVLGVFIDDDTVLFLENGQLIERDKSVLLNVMEPMIKDGGSRRKTRKNKRRVTRRKRFT